MPSGRTGASGSRVRLLEADPDLGRWLSPGEVVDARLYSVVPVLRLDPGPWTPAPCQSRRHDLGYLLLDGLVARDELLAGSTATELLGPGELIQPWTQRPDELFVPRKVVWTALEDTTLAVLGPPFEAVTGRWPALRSALLERAMRRCSWLSTQHALSQLSRVDARLVVLFWHLAERWGKVVPGGVVVPLSLSHVTLGHLVGAKRPTVTLALHRLEGEGLVERPADARWLLRGDPAAALRRLESEPAASGRRVVSLPVEDATGEAPAGAPYAG